MKIMVLFFRVPLATNHFVYIYIYLISIKFHAKMCKILTFNRSIGFPFLLMLLKKMWILNEMFIERKRVTHKCASDRAQYVNTPEQTPRPARSEHSYRLRNQMSGQGKEEHNSEESSMEHAQ